MRKLSVLILCAWAYLAEGYRLQKNVIPQHYELALETNLDAANFNGNVTIRVAILSPTNIINLHAKALFIDNVTVTPHNLTEDPISTHFRVNNLHPFDFLVLTCNRSLNNNSSYDIEINFRGNLGLENIGYYLNSYISEGNNTRKFAVTHFESTNARRAFPCFDQINMKATFNISLTRPASYRTTSNMQLLLSKNVGNNIFLDCYATSVPMSTYLVAFMVSDFAIDTTTRIGTVYNVFGRPELINRNAGKYALEIGSKTIETMNTYTKNIYPLPKMDQIAIPNDDLKISGMENWGMVTYREKLIMYNEDTSTTSEKQSTLSLITHEFAHQWFGNLVTPVWWTYIWLNEGFATFFQMYIGSMIEPTWDMQNQFLITKMSVALEHDALETTRPMTTRAESPSEIAALYDTVAYEKAGCVVQMVKGFLGDDVFRTGLSNYLRNWTYSTVQPQNLYSSLQEASLIRLTVDQIMLGWVTQAGYPVVHVERDYINGSVTLSQQRFLLRNSTGNVSTWSIPITWHTEREKSKQVTWLPNNPKLNLYLTDNAWFIVNNNRTGFYRVNYDVRNWNLLATFLENKNNIGNISIANRAQLIDDSFALARSGRLVYSIALRIGRYISNEIDYVPIYTFTNAYSFLHRMFEEHGLLRSIQNYGIQALNKIYLNTGFEILRNDTHLNKLRQVNVLTWLCDMGHADCRSRSRTAFRNWISNPANAIQPDAQSFVYCNGIRETGATEWNLVLSQRYPNTREDNHRSRLATALGCTRNHTLLVRLLQNIVNTTTFGKTDRLNVITSIYTNSGGTGIIAVLDFLTTNYVQVRDSVGSISKIIKGVAARITTNTQLSKFDLFDTNNRRHFTPEITETIQEARATAAFNIDWIHRTSIQFNTFFNTTNSAPVVIGQIVLIFSCILIALWH